MNARSVVLAIAGMILQNVLMLGTGVMIARAIGSGDYGVSNLLRSLLQFALMLAPLGLDIALQKHVGAASDPASARVDVNRLRLLVVGGCALVVLLIPFGLGALLNRQFYHLAHFETYLIITFAALPLMTDMAILGGVFRGRGNPAPQVLANYYIQPILRLVMVVVFLQLGWGLMGVLAANTLGFLTGFIVLNGYFHLVQDRNTKRVASQDRPSWRSTLSLAEPALWMAMSAFFYSTIRNVDVLILGAVRPMKEVGEYASLSTIAQFAQFFPLALSLTLGPVVARLYAVGDVGGIDRHMTQYLRTASLLGAPIFAAGVAWGPVLDILFGPTFEYSSLVALLLPLTYLVSGVLSPMGYGLSMTGRHRMETAILVSGNLLVVGLCVVFAKRFGQAGVAASVLAGYVYINVMRFMTVSRALGFVPGSLRDFIPPLVCVVIAVAVKVLAFRLFARDAFTLVGSGLIFGLIVAAIYWFLLTTNEERAWVLRAIKVDHLRRRA